MAIHHYSVHSPLQSPYNFLACKWNSNKKRVLIVPLLEREREGGRGEHLQKCINLYILHPHTQERKKGVPFTPWCTSHCLHENSNPKIGYHYFWPVLIALPKNTLPIHCQLWIRFGRKLGTWVLFIPGNWEWLWKKEKSIK